MSDREVLLAVVEALETGGLMDTAWIPRLREIANRELSLSDFEDIEIPDFIKNHRPR